MNMYHFLLAIFDLHSDPSKKNIYKTRLLPYQNKRIPRKRGNGFKQMNIYFFNFCFFITKSSFKLTTSYFFSENFSADEESRSLPPSWQMSSTSILPSNRANSYRYVCASVCDPSFSPSPSP